MQYAEYRKKMIKLASVLKTVKRFRVPIISACLVLVALVTVLLCIRGIVYEVSSCPQTITYGENLGFRAKAVMGGVVYEYADADGENWSETQPLGAGSYKVRALSKSITGSPRYGKAHSFTILQKSIEVRAADFAEYGENPELIADLSFADSIYCDNFFFDDKYAETTEVLPDIGSVAIYDEKGADVTSSYVVTAVKSEISLGKRAVTVAAASAEKEYDGETLTASGYDLGEYTLAYLDKLSFSGCAGSLVNAGSIENKFDGEIKIFNEKGEDVTNRYDLTITSGTLTVNKRVIGVLSGDAEKEYDGEALTCRDFTDDGRLISGHSLKVAAYVEQLDAGERDNTLSFAVSGANGADETANYEIVLTAGTLKVTPREITVTTQDKSWAYGGIAYSWEGHDVTGGSLVAGHKSKAYNLSYITDVGSCENIFDISVYDGNFDVTENYSITVIAGTLTVHSATLKIYSDDFSWVYDGGEHSFDGCTQEGLAGIHTLSSTALSKITEVGTCDNKIEVRVFSGKEDVTENYSIQYFWGTLEVTPRPVTVTADGAQKVYDGTPLSCNTVSADNLVSGHKVTAKVSGSGTDAGEYKNSVVDGTVKICGADGKDLTKNYEITLADGVLKITPRPITVITADGEWTYDGDSHYNKTYKIVAALDFALVSGHTPAVQSYTEICNAGEKENILTIKIFSGAKDVTSNYEINYDNGTLKINPRPITVKTDGATKIYDGTPLTYEGYTLTSKLTPALVKDHCEEVSFTGAQTDAGTGENTVKVKILSDTDGDVSDNYAVTVEAGSLIVTKRPVTVVTLSGEWVYDGVAHSRPYKISEDAGMGVLAAHSVEILSQTSITDVGSVKNDIKIKITADGKDLSANYDISYEYGTLKVTQRPVVVTADSAQKQYDGTPLVCGTVSGDNFVTGHTATAQTVGSQTEVGESTNRIVAGTVVIVDKNGADVTKNYSITTANGVLTVVRREITLKAGDANKVYDGDALTNAQYSVVSTVKLVTGHSLTARTTGSQTDAGEGVNAIVPESVKITYNGKDMTANYVVTLEEGTLTVQTRPITVTSGSAEKEYDGTPLTCDKYTVTSSYDPALVKDHKATVVITGSRTDAGESGNTIESVTITSASGDVTKNYRITVKNGTLTVGKKILNVTSMDGEWVYDGELHYCDEFEYDGNLDGHTVECYYHNYIRDVESYDNIITVKVYSDVYDVTKNYRIIYTYGTLTVTKREVYLTTASMSWVYDGEAHSAPEVEEDENSPYGLVEGHFVAVSSFTEITFVGSVKNDLVLSIYGDYNVTANYGIHLSFGTLEVTKRPVEVVYRYDNIYFTGAAVYERISTNSLRSVSEYPLVSGEIFTVTAICNEVELGEATLCFEEGSARVTDITGGKDLTSNYDITLLSKQVQIVQREIIIQSGTAEKIYDGTPLVCEEYEVLSGNANAFLSKNLVEGHSLSEIEITFTGSLTEIGEDYNYFTVDNFKVVDGEGNDVTYGYTIHNVNGNLYVTEFGSLHVKTSSAAKIYDGTPLTSKDYTVESTLADGYKYYIFITGAQTVIGSSDNTFEVIVISPDRRNVTDKLTLFEELGTLTVLESGGRGGSGEGDLDVSGDIGGDGGDVTGGEDAVALRVYSEATGSVYMRLQSYGNYTGTGWNPANPYSETIDGTYGMNYLTGMALGGAGRDAVFMQVDVTGNYYYLPYYLAAGNYGYKIQQSDILYSGDTSAVYSLYYYPYDYLKEGAVKLYSSELTEAERAYRQFVYDNYLAVPATTAAYLETVIAAQGFDISDSRLIAKIASYVQSAAVYNANYNTALNSERDMVVSFLRDYKEGVCRHYASAATLLYRMMGIPARYTIGYVGNTSAGEWVEIHGGNAHAWVEIYIDGEGWVQIEVTGSGQSDFGDINIGELTPADLIKEYDGTPLVANRLVENGTLASLVAQGFTYTAEFSGSQTNVGVSSSRVENFRLFDPEGKPVISGVNWYSGIGKLTVVTSGTLITVHLYYLGCEYDGNSHSLGSNDWYAEGLPAGYTIEFDPSSISATAANSFDWNALKTLPLHMYNERGLDVTANYYIIFSYESEGGCEGEGVDISSRQITVSTQTAEKEYDGKPLTDGGWWISFGTLAEGHRIEVTVTGALTEVGMTENSVGNCVIYDANGKDVTSNYNIKYACGMLKVID